MKRMEDELRQALRRHSPPEGFADRLLAEAARRPAGARARRNRRQGFGGAALRWACVAAVVLAMIAGVRYQSHRIETARGMAAKEQLVLALRITAAELQFAQEKVLEIGREGRPSAAAH
jgi:hypothetical protein